MKGVIIAGGKGTRLRPLTNHLPKPLIPIYQKPVMEYAIEHLKNHGITDIAVTVQYLSDKIKNYFGNGEHLGVKIAYFEEEEPLGTAGSIKNAESFLDEPFVVVSGDVLTNFNIAKGIQFHNEKNSLFTIFMKQVENPFDYGVMLTNAEGKVTRFLEKPSLQDAFSNKVNTGIYIVDPTILSFVKKGQYQDFSIDLFPKLITSGYQVYGYPSDGYWSDVGNIDRYRQTLHDVKSGLFKVSV